MKKSKRNLAFYEYLGAVQTALDTIPEKAKEDIEDKAGAYFAAVEEEGFEYEEGWEFPFWNKPEFYTYKEGDGRAAAWEIGRTVCENEPQEGLAFLCNATAGFTTERTMKTLTSFGEAISEFVQAEDSPEAKAKLSEAVSENESTLKRAGFSVFVPEGEGFKEIK